jgi:glycosyltransferase involved in cell wall biosynthesis
MVFNQVGRGTYWRALHLGRQLVRRGHRVTLMATAQEARFRLSEREVDGIRLVETPDQLPGARRSGWDPWNAARRTGWLRDRTFDLVHAFEMRPVVLLPALVAQRRGALWVADWCDWFGRGGSVEERSNPFLRWVLRPVETFFEERFRTRADAATVINSTLRQKALDLGVPAERVLLFPNGTDLEGIQPQDQGEVRQRLRLPLDVKLVAYTGALFRRDAALMAAAFDRIHAAEPSARLLLIGYCNQPVETMVRTPEAVWRTGPVNSRQLADYLSASDVGWLPLTDCGANRGRFPMKVSDFMAAGLPVAASDVGDVGALLREVAIGRLALAQPESMADAMLALLADAAERERLGRRARQVAEARFAWPLIGELVEHFYETIMGSETNRGVAAGPASPPDEYANKPLRSM